MTSKLKRLTAVLAVFAVLSGLVPSGTWLPPLTPVPDAGALLDYASFTTSIEQIVAGENHTVALLGDGSVWAWGENQYGQLGDQTNTNRKMPKMVIGPGGFSVGGVSYKVESIAAGANHTLAVLSNGYVLAWGKNRNGQLGDGTTANRSRPVPVMMADGSYFTAEAWGPGDEPTISAGFAHTMAINADDGCLYGWGFNNYGQLGVGNNTSSTTPLLVKLIPDEYERDLDGRYEKDEKGNRILIVYDQPLTELVAAGYNHTIVYADGSLYVFGCNANGQLGLNDFVNRNTPVIMGEDDDTIEVPPAPTALRSGNAHSMALSGNDLYGWGSNLFGQIQLDNENPSIPSPVLMRSDVEDVQAGYNHNVMLLNDSSVYTSGYNTRGQIGNGAAGPTSVSYPVTIDDPDFESDIDPEDPTTWAIATHPDQLPLMATTVFAGYYFSGVINEDGELMMWGDNGYGQLGDGTVLRRPKPNWLPMLVFDPDTQISAATRVELDRDFMTIGLGYDHSSLLTATVNPDNVLYGDIKWTSDNPDVVMIIEEPLDESEDDYTESIYPRSRVRLIGNKKAGTAIITATAYNNKSASCSVTVKPNPETVTITTFPRKMVAVGDSFRFKAEVKGISTYIKTVEWSIVTDPDGTDEELDYEEDEHENRYSYDPFGCAYINVDTGLLTVTDIGTIYVQARSVMDPNKRDVVKVETGVFSTGVEIYAQEYDPYDYEQKPVVSPIILHTDNRSGYMERESMQLYPVSFPYETDDGMDAFQIFRWSSGAEGVVTVTQDGFITAQKPGTAAIRCTAADGSGKFRVVVVSVVPLGEGIELVKPAPSRHPDTGEDYIRIVVDQRVTLKTKVKPARAGQKVEWSDQLLENYPDADVNSATSLVATISTKGVLQGLQPGTCKVVASVLDTDQDDPQLIQYELLVEVIRPVSKVTLFPKKLTLVEGDVYDELLYYLMPDTASIMDVTWTSSNTNTVAVEADDDGANPILTAKMPGTAKITCLAADGSGRKATMTVTVKSRPSAIRLNYITIDEEAALRLNAGRSLKLKAYVEPSSAFSDVRWELEVIEGNGFIAEVSATGNVKAYGEGLVAVRAVSTYDEEIYSDWVYVRCAVPVKTFKIKPTTIKVTEGSSVMMTVDLQPYEATNKGITLTSPRPDDIYCEDDGEFIELNYSTFELFVADGTPPGNYSLVFNCDGKKSTVKLTVYSRPESIDILPDEDNRPEIIAKGKTLQLKAIVREQGANQSVTWVSSNESAVTVDAKGKLKGVGSGVAEVWCYANDDPDVVSDSFEITCFVPVTSVKLKPTLAKLTKDTLVLVEGAENEEIQIVVSPIDAEVTEEEWEILETYNDSVISIDYTEGNDFFVITPDGPGSTTVTVVVGGKRASIKVRVIPNPNSIEINPPQSVADNPDYFLLKGNTLAMKATVEPAGQTVYWEVDDPSVASVSTKGVVSVKSAGTVNVYAYVYTADGDLMYSDPFELETRVPVSGLTAKPKSVKLETGETSEEIIISARPEGAYPGKEDSKAAEWRVSPAENSIASASITEDESGYATLTITAGDKKGKTTFTVYYGGKSTTVSVTVSEPKE